MERLTGQTFHDTFGVNGRGEVCPQAGRWSPRTLAAALSRAGHPVSHITLWRAALRGEIPHTRTPGGHVRIDARWVAETFPQLAANVAA